MKNFYNLFFSLNNINTNEDYLFDLNEVEDKKSDDHKFLNKFFEKTFFSPSQELVDEIVNLVKKGEI